MIQFAHLLGVEHGEGVWSVLTSGPHLLAELVLLAVFDGLIGALAWPLFKRWLHRHDEQEHHPDMQMIGRILEAHLARIEDLEVNERQDRQRLLALTATVIRHTQEVGE